MKRHIGFARVVVVAMLVATATLAAMASSHVRIVRLSSVEGNVQMDRAGQGMERAILNTPIVEGSSLKTGSEGLAEVEFEDQSALRLTEDSEVKFSELQMNDAGDKLNRIRVDKGMVYLDTAGKGNDTYQVSVGGKSVLIGRNSLVRLNATPDQLQVAVFKGEAQLEGQAQPVTIHKKETLTAALQNAGDFNVAKGVEEDRFDNWNKERQDYSKTYASNQGYGGPNRGYGMQDLNYYGDFFYANGYGYVWQPYGFAGAMASWNPYMNGAWMFYPGMGYSFASAYPWGWLPFHYGSWAFLNGAGWAWVPGRYNNQWYQNGYRTAPQIAKAPAGWTAPAAPTAVAGPITSPTVIVGRAPTAPLTIPGGRIPPNFASVVRGHTVTPTPARGFERPNTTVANRSVFASPQAAKPAQPGANGHVFAQPPSRSVFADDIPMRAGGGGAGGRSAGAPMTAAPSRSATGSSAGHVSSPSAAAGGAHK
jgi:hypothetical protein